MSVPKVVKKRRSLTKLRKSGLPIIIVNKSNKHIMAQLLDIETGNTVFTITSHSIKEGTKTEKSAIVGQKVAEKLKSLSITRVVFNRNGAAYHGRIKALAEAIRKNNINM